MTIARRLPGQGYFFLSLEVTKVAITGEQHRMVLPCDAIVEAAEPHLVELYAVETKALNQG
jgi:hypothetical protein